MEKEVTQLLLGSLKLNDQQCEFPIRYEGQTISFDKSVGHGSIPWVAINRTLFCTLNLIVDISWEALESNKLITGQKINIDGFPFLSRVPTPGIEDRDEWDAAMELYNGDNTVLHWRGCPSWCQEKYAANMSMRIVRGGEWAKRWGGLIPFEKAGWRPVLEPIGIDPSRFRFLLMEELLYGQELLIWSEDLVFRGTLVNHTAYDLILIPSSYMAVKTSSMHQITNGELIIDRAQIDCIQLGYSQY